MKRKGLLFVATLLLSVFSLCLVACSDSNNNTDGDNSPHVHDYKIEKSETMHWLKCDCGDTKDYNVHSGGTATCVAKAECSVCGETYGELGEHNYGVWTSNNNSTHSKVCSYESSHLITENCSGGTATEEERATCEVCNGKHGSQLNHTHNFNKQEVKETYLKSKATCEERAVYYYSCSCGEKGNTTFEVGETLGHAYGDWISNGDNTHTKTCSNDNNHKITENCSGGTATCEEQAICKDCGFAYGETLGHNYGVWVSNGNNTHTKTCSNDNNHKITENCNGGTATCEKQAICKDCSSAYGETLGHNYGVWVSNGDNTHTKTCSNDNNHKITENCNGGTATCAIKAVCTDCKTSYGPFKNHPVEDWTITETHHYQQTTCSCNLKLNYGEHQTDDSGFCISCDKAINPTVGILYDISSDGTYAEVIGYNGTSTKINIASNYNNLPVKTIYNEAFREKYNITKVIIPDSVTSIGVYAFDGCYSLQSVTFGENSKLTSIGDWAFSGCGLLQSVTIGNSVTSIGENVFLGCYLLISEVENIQYIKANDNPYYLIQDVTNKNLSTYTIHSNVKIIGKIAFMGCGRLSNIAIPSSVTSIGEAAFHGCKNLQSVTFGENSKLTSIGDSAFYNCSNLRSITFGGTMEQWKNAVGNTSIDYHGKVICKDGTD